MRIAVLFHALQTCAEAESEHAISAIARIWRESGHEVKFLIGPEDGWEADVALVHVDLSVVPRRYARRARAARRPLNDRILDIRKSVISRNLVKAHGPYAGPVIVKANLNSDGIPERKLLPRSPWYRLLRRFGLVEPLDPLLEYVKRYHVYESMREVPAEESDRPGAIMEKFLPEREGDWYFVRRCFALGSNAISYRMGDRQPVVEGGDSAAFDWVETSPEVLSFRREIGLDYGVVDYTLHGGAVAILDANKTPGLAYTPDEASRRNYETILRHAAAGIGTLARG